MTTSSTRVRGDVIWPWCVSGFLLPFSETQLSRWMTPAIAVGIAFVLLFTAAGLVVARREGRLGACGARVVGGAGLGAVIAGGFRYLFP